MAIVLDFENLVEFHHASNNITLDAALIFASKDLEESLISPIWVPRVGNKPVWGAVLHSPAKDLDSMSS